LYLKELEDQRKGLIQFIESYRPQGSVKNTVTIVFDGKSGYVDQVYASQIKVLFSKDESADNVIKRKVAKAQNPKQIVVVSNDREIQCAVRALGAKVLSVQDFLQNSSCVKKRKRISKSESQNSETPKKISKTMEFQIYQELEKVWIKKKKSS